WLSPSWSAELTEQAIARVYRPGQTRHVTVHVCVAAGTVDEMKRDRVIGKMSAQEAFRRHLEQTRNALTFSAEGREFMSMSILLPQGPRLGPPGTDYLLEGSRAVVGWHDVSRGP